MFRLHCYIPEKILWQATNLTGSLTNLWVSSYNITTAKAFVFHHLSSQEISQASCSCWGTRLSVSIVLQRFAHGRWFRNVTQKFTVCHINSLILFKRFLNIDSVSLLLQAPPPQPVECICFYHCRVLSSLTNNSYFWRYVAMCCIHIGQEHIQPNMEICFQDSECWTRHYSMVLSFNMLKHLTACHFKIQQESTSKSISKNYTSFPVCFQEINTFHVNIQVHVNTLTHLKQVKPSICHSRYSSIALF